MKQTKGHFSDIPLSSISLLDLRFLGWYNEKTNEPVFRRPYIEHHPRAYWDGSDVYTLSIYCEQNYHGDYYLHLSKNVDNKWHCFLVNGKWSETFIHLRLLEYLSELQEIVWALTRCNLFHSEAAMKEYCKQLNNHK